MGGNENTAVIFIDTNVALHYKRLDQIDWKREVDEKRCEIVVCSVFLAELEKHKVEHSNKKIRKRAGEYSTWLAKKYDDPVVRTGAQIRFLPDEPMIDFDAYRLDPTNFDDRLVAAVIELSQQESNSRFYVMTADLGLTLKLRSRGLSAIKPSDTYELPEEVSDEERENKELRAQLAKLTHRMPKPTLQFKSGEQILVVQQQTLLPKDAFIQEAMTKLRSKHPFMDTAPVDNHFNSLTKSPTMLQIGQTVRSLALNRDRIYNSSLQNYFVEYEGYLEQCYVYGLHRAAICKLDLILSNLDGSMPANNVDIYLKCEKPTKLLTEDDWPTAPKRPIEPEQPGVFGTTSSRLNVPLIPQIRTMADVLRDADQTRPRLTTTKGNATFYLHQIKHRQTSDLLPIWLDFSTLKERDNVLISFEIHASEILEPVTGTLHVRITR
ncbi:PIN domain-containing protein [Massilia sp. Root335]|uniref:PIN domain-containing protein n=1 Tax=Massilia sp. Root335 TaxID=1736517 RepID=UPI0009EA3158|nr:PIN domain-containing protein [Massilia sp. Root335]